MLTASGYPGMKIMQFAFRQPGIGQLSAPHLPPQQCGVHRHPRQRDHRGLAQQRQCRGCCLRLPVPALHSRKTLTEGMICACLASVSDTAIIPLADWLHLGSEARINTPSTQGANWQLAADAVPCPQHWPGTSPQLTTLYERVPEKR